MSADVVRLIPCGGGALDRVEVHEAVAEWIHDPLFTAVVRSFSGPVPGGQDLRRDIASLVRFSDVWDRRGGRERNLAAAIDLPDEIDALVTDAARRLGLVDVSRPPRARYDHCLVLGGLIRACLLRPMWAARLMDEGLGVSDVVALGGFRPLGGDEPSLASLGGLDGVTDEYEAMNAGLQSAFGLPSAVVEDRGAEGEGPNARWAVSWYHAGDRDFRVIAAPSRDPENRRANSADTYLWWASGAQLGPDESVLLITSAIYVPYQHAAAVRVLGIPYGCAIDTVGIPPDVTGPLPPQTFTSAHYLQEMRSTLREFAGLLDSLAET